MTKRDAVIGPVPQLRQQAEKQPVTPVLTERVTRLGLDPEQYAARVNTQTRAANTRPCSGAVSVSPRWGMGVGSAPSASYSPLQRARPREKGRARLAEPQRQPQGKAGDHPCRVTQLRGQTQGLGKQVSH